MKNDNIVERIREKETLIEWETVRFDQRSERLPILRSCRIYYKSGSKMYVSHSIPEEIIPAVKEALESWEVIDTLGDVGWKVIRS